MKSLTFASCLAPNTKSVYQFVAARIGILLGCETRFTTGGAEADLLTGQVDVAFICGLPYVRLFGRPGHPVRLLAAPVIDDPRSKGRPIYFSDVIVRADSARRSFRDLRGCTFAHSHPDSFSGYVATRYRLLEMGESERFFGQVRFSGGHQESIRQVCAGEVDASAIDSHVLAVELRQHPELASKIRIVKAIGPAPIPPVVVRAGLPPPFQARLREALCHLGDDELDRERLGEGLIRRFVPAEDAAYDDIRRKLAAIEPTAAAS
jgi:phosphonate transport system substrate-binding protein